MSKRGWIVLLTGINLFLLGAMLLTVYTPPSALAQAVGARRGDYLLISARAEVFNDAIYLLDAGNRRIHVFRSAFPRAPNGATDVVHASSYDLARDFMGQAGPGAGGAPGQAPQNLPPEVPGILPGPGGQQP